MGKLDLFINNFDALNKEFKIIKKQLKEENEEFFNAIVENSNHFIAIVQNEKYVFVNSTGLQLFKAKSSTDIIGKDIKDTVHPDCWNIISASIPKTDKILRKTIQIIFECTDGASFDCECNISPFVYNKQPAILIIGRDITNETKHQARLQSDEKLRTDILNAFHEVIAFYSPIHTFLWLNDAGKKLLNFHDDSYIGKLCYKMWFNAEKPCHTCPVVTRVIEPLERIVTIGNKKWMIKHTPLFDKIGILTGYIEFRTDITEKENMKTELEKSHARQIRAELTNSFGHFEIDLLTNRFLLSPGTINILGLHSEKNKNISEEDFFKYIHQDDSSEIFKQFNLAYSGEKKLDRIFRIIDENCVEKTIRCTGEVKSDTYTGNKKFFAVIQDITRISNLEKQIFDEREKYKMLAENAPFGLILTKDNKPVYINKTLVDWFGFESVSNLNNTGFVNFFHLDDKKVVQMISTKIKENNVPFPLVEKLRFIHKDGRIRHVRLDLKNNMIQDQNYVQIVITDITEDVIKEKKQKQIAADALYINQKNSILNELENVLSKILANKKFSKTQKDFSKIYSIINSYKQLDKDWKMLVANFEEVHPGFFSRLKRMYPKLTPVDMKHCACIKMYMDTKEIARFFNIKVTSVQISRVRIKKKMNLPDTIDLRSHILNL